MVWLISSDFLFTYRSNDVKLPIYSKYAVIRRSSMKVVIAIDSFKGCLSSMEAGNAARDGVLLARPDAQVTVMPLADGGEGTASALTAGMKGYMTWLNVTGPMGDRVRCCYGILPRTMTAVMEMAAAAGLTLVDPQKRDPLKATTFGVGEMIIDAVHKGCRNFIIGIGGSATNDGGIGMLKALGVSFYDRYGNDPGQGAQALSRIARIKTVGMEPLLKSCRFRIACDVNNPLYGKNGATYIYGRQKGVADNMLEPLDKAMASYGDIVKKTVCCDFTGYPGAGAAGGLGFAFLSFLNGELSPGTDLVMEATGLENAVKDADIVITGEGRLDHQTSMGKAPVRVARLAHRYHAKVIAVAGSITKDTKECNDAGIDAFFPILRSTCSLDEAMDPKNAVENIKDTVEQIFRLL